MNGQLLELGDFGLREILEASPRADASVDELGDDNARFDAHRAPYGRISMGVLSGVKSQISTMSAFVTAIHPSVQSRVS